MLTRLESLLAEDDTRSKGVFEKAAPLLHAALGVAADFIDGFVYQQTLDTLRRASRTVRVARLLILEERLSSPMTTG